VIYGKEVFIGLFNNLALVIILVAVYGYMFNKLRSEGWIKRQVIFGLIFSVFVLGCMQVRLHVWEGVIVDQRNAMVILCGSFGGPLAAVIAAACAASYRIYLGGTGIYGGTLGVVLSMIVGIVIYYNRPRINTFWKAVIVAAAATVFILPGFLPIESLANGLKLLQAMAIPYGTAIALGLILGGFLLYNEEHRNRAQWELKESELKYRELFESIVDVSFKIDRNGKIEIISPSCEKMLGFRRDEIEGRSIESMYSKSPSYYEFIQRVERDGFVENLESEIIRKDGSVVVVSTNAKRMNDSRGNLICVQGVSRDITQIRHAEAENRCLEENLRQSQKMESIGRLAGGIAHDFNNILTAVLGYAEISLNRLSDNEPLRKNLDGIMTAGLRAKDLVSHILMFSRKTLPNKVPVQINMVVKDALALLRASTPSTIDIMQDIDIPAASILADPTAIHQVVMNLCTNAAQAMGADGGVINVALKRVVVTPDMIHGDTPVKPGNHIALSISDTGKGIDQEDIPRIFDPYFTTKGAGQGTGMGLAVVHGIVRGHQGMITVESEKGKGSTFTVFLPEIHETAESVDDEDIRLPKGNERILLVDDEPTVVDVTTKRLEMLGYTVTGFTGSREAIDSFVADPSRFDLVITDQTMPVITGKMLAKRLKEIRPDIPIVLCTGYSSPVDTGKDNEFGICEFVMKPVRLKDLALIIRRILDSR